MRERHLPTDNYHLNLTLCSIIEPYSWIQPMISCPIILVQSKHSYTIEVGGRQLFQQKDCKHS